MKSLKKINNEVYYVKKGIAFNAKNTLAFEKRVKFTKKEKEQEFVCIKIKKEQVT